jgi:predicted transcriptional regulator
MEKITRKEEEIMTKFWARGAMFVRELVGEYPDPKPHFNTLSTMVRTLESKGYLSHTAFGSTFRYFPVITEEQFRNGTLKGVINKYFENSYLGAVSTLVREEKISIADLKELIKSIERQEP